jgi:serine protease AprX
MAHFRFFRRVAIASVVLASSFGAVRPAAAQPHRARLSADLSEALRTGAPGVDVIVHGDKATVDAIAARHAIRVKRYLKSGAVFHLTAGQLSELQDDSRLDHLSSDVRIASSDVTTDTIEAGQVWAGAGPIVPSIGTGVGVAVIDSGVDFNHDALKGRIVASVDFTGGDGADKYGHGTHVASTIAGAPGSSQLTSDYRGVAPGARIINLRVLGADGSGMASDVIEAIDWAIENRARYNIRVINLSLGAPVLQPYRDDPLCEATERAVQAGIVVVAAAGNFGVTKDGTRVMGGITSPGNDPLVLTVGALDAHATGDRSDDTVATFSSRGPAMYDLTMKPDLVAPGSHVVAAEAPRSYLATQHPDHLIAGAGEGAYFQLSGTSMASAVASGVVALVLDQHPRLSPGELKTALQMTSTLMPEAGLLASGAGSINAYAAVEFADGAIGEALAASLGGSFTQAARQSGLPLTRVHAQLVSTSLTTAGVKATVITFGATSGRGGTTVWGKTVRDGKVYVWGRVTKSHSALYTQGVVLGQDDSDTIIWGQDDSDTIIWGQDDSDTIIWGQDDSDTIIWGQDDSDTIIWGQDDSDTIIWGQ